MSREIDNEDVNRSKRTLKIGPLFRALMAGEWVPGDPGPKGRKPIFRTGSTWGGSSKVTSTRKARLKALGVEIDVGADNPGRPDTPDKVLDLVRSSKWLSHIWRLTTGEDPHNPVSKGGMRAGVRAYDRSSTEFKFALHAALLGETPEDIQEALMAMGGKTAERGDEYFESNILDPVLERLEKIGREWGGAKREVAPIPGVPQKKYSKQTRDVLVPGEELPLSGVLNSVYAAGRDVVLLAQNDGRRRFDALRVFSGELIKLGVPQATVFASLTKANVSEHEYEEAWCEVWGRVETGDRPPWFGGLRNLYGKEEMANNALEKIRREVQAIKDAPHPPPPPPELLPFDVIDAELKAEEAARAAAAASPPASVKPKREETDPSLIDPADRDPTDRDDYVAPTDSSLIDPADRDPTDRDDYASPKHGMCCPNHTSCSHTHSSTTPSKAKRAPKDVTEEEAIRRAQIYPTSLNQLNFAAAKDYLFDPKRFRPGGDTALVDTREVLGKIQDQLVGDNRFWFVQKVVAENFVFAGLDIDLVTRTTGRGKRKFDALRKAYVEALAKLRRWKKGEPLPKFASLGSIKSTIGHWSYLELSDSISNDLTKLKAPFEVKHRATLDQPWSKKDRQNMRSMIDRRTGGDNERAKGPLAFILDSARCGWMVNERTCPDHHLVSASAVVCEREVSCKYCRSHLYAWIADWVTHKWKHDKYVTFEVKATTEKVIKEIREKFEVDANGKKVDKSEPSHPEDEKSEWSLLPKAFPEEKRFRIMSVVENGVTKHIAMKCVAKRRRNQHRVVGRKTVDNLLDRIKIGFTRSEDFKTFKKTFGKKLGVRAWPTPDGIRVVMPSTFLEDSPVPGEMPEERDTLERLMLECLWKEQTKTVVSKEEALTLILDARKRIGDGFDELVDALAENQPDEADSDSVAQDKAVRLASAEDKLATYPFLRNQAMKPVKNKAAERDLPWFTKGQMREFMRQLAAERRGEDLEDVAPHECPVQVDDGHGGKRACRKMLHVGLKCREGIVAQNNQGRFYAKEEAYDLGEKQGVFSGVRVGAFAHAA